jgi:hypothetical protein
LSWGLRCCWREKDLLLLLVVRVMVRVKKEMGRGRGREMGKVTRIGPLG